MAHPVQVEVVAADHKVFTGQAESVVIPGTNGYFGVLHGHAPMISGLAIGEVDVIPPDRAPMVSIAVSGGFVEVTPDRVVILAESAELAQDIDLERARQAVDRAENRLREREEATDIDRARIALQRALNRLRVAETRRGM